jgi:hypothetical protein
VAYSNRNRRWLLTAVIISGLLMIIFGGYWALKGDREPVQPTKLPRMANLPPRPETTTPPPPSYAPDAPVLEQAREALREGISPAEAVTMAKTLPDRPERADAAFLLLEYAAERGNTEAAFAVGLFYDPAYEGSSGSIRKNPITAYEWYQKALAGGQKQAQDQLARLRLWVEEKAEQGSGQAKELLSSWH